MTTKTKKRLCGAKGHRGGKCALEAGWGTDHLGTGRCRYHGGVVGKNHGAPKGSQNALKHGIYSRVLKDADIDAAMQMQGSIDTELAIARLQLARVIGQMQEQGDYPELDQIEEKTIAVGEDPDRADDRVKKARAADAKRCGEHYDPDDDDDVPSNSEESEPLERKRTYKRRDWTGEYTRLTALVARLESQRLAMLHKQVEIERLKKEVIKDGGGADVDDLTDTELDSEICQFAEGLTTSVSGDTDNE